jgi:hypothetical protein
MIRLSEIADKLKPLTCRTQATVDTMVRRLVKEQNIATATTPNKANPRLTPAKVVSEADGKRIEEILLAYIAETEPESLKWQAEREEKARKEQPPPKLPERRGLEAVRPAVEKRKEEKPVTRKPATLPLDMEHLLGLTASGYTVTLTEGKITIEKK